MLDKLIKASWLIPILAALLPLFLGLFGWVMSFFGHDGLFIDQFLWLTFIVAPIVGVLTFAILKVQNNLGRAGMRQRKIRYAALFAGIDIIAPICLIVLFLYGKSRGN